MLVGVFELVVEFFEVAVDGFTRFMVVVGRSFFCCFSNYADKPPLMPLPTQRVLKYSCSFSVLLILSIKRAVP